MTVAAPRFRLQPRDVAFLVTLGDCGNLSGTMAHQNCFPTMGGRAFRRRMQILCENRIIARVQLSQLDLLNPNGRPPSIYVLSDKGADLVYRHTGNRPKPHRTSANPFTLQHRLAVAQLQLTFLKSVEHHALKSCTWINEWNTAASSKQGDTFDKRFVLYEVFDGVGGPNQSVSCRPDAAFRLDHQEWNLLGYVERDRSTETHRQFANKIPGYESLVKQQRFSKHFPGCSKPVFRLYVVCESAERISGLREILAKSSLGTMARFAEATALHPETVFAKPVWQDATGKHVPILQSLA